VEILPWPQSPQRPSTWLCTAGAAAGEQANSGRRAFSGAIRTAHLARPLHRGGAASSGPPNPRAGTWRPPHGGGGGGGGRRAGAAVAPRILRRHHDRERQRQQTTPTLATRRQTRSLPYGNDGGLPSICRHCRGRLRPRRPQQLVWILVWIACCGHAAFELVASPAALCGRRLPGPPPTCLQGTGTDLRTCQK
jgi:hypothetical protein